MDILFYGVIPLIILLNTFCALNLGRIYARIHRVSFQQSSDVSIKDALLVIGYSFTHFSTICYILIGLFSSNWVTFIILLLTLVLSFDNTHLVFGKMKILFINLILLFIFINKFYLHYNLNEYILNFLNL